MTLGFVGAGSAASLERRAGFEAGVADSGTDASVVTMVLPGELTEDAGLHGARTLFEEHRT